MAQHRVLLLDPEPGLLGGLTLALSRRGHRPVRRMVPEDTLAALAGPDLPELVVVRPGGPVQADICFLRRVRQVSSVPCILIGGAADDVAHRVTALDIGADDSIHRTMPLTEMLARVLAVLRRTSRHPAGLALPAAPDRNAGAALPGGWRLLPHRRALVAEDARHSIPLTGAEFELLRLLATRAPEAVDREAISHAVFRRPWQLDDRAIDGLVKRLRRKLDHGAIVTVRGVGYAFMKFEAAHPVAAAGTMQASLLSD